MPQLTNSSHSPWTDCLHHTFVCGVDGLDLSFIFLCVHTCIYTVKCMYFHVCMYVYYKLLHHTIQPNTTYNMEHCMKLLVAMRFILFS